jgi:medium-chain acyl-[acyl-carrier-protein] hydrolase
MDPFANLCLSGRLAEGENIYEQDYRVRSYEVDARGRLSLLSLFNYLQAAASAHASHLKVSVQDLMPNGCTWVLSRLALKIGPLPGAEAVIRIRTWPSGYQRLFALRDFEILGPSGHALGAAVSAWLVIDTSRRKPVRIGPFLEKLNPLENRHAWRYALDKLPAGQTMQPPRRFTVRYRDLDINGHVNNATFVEWVLESVPDGYLNERNLAFIEINYLSEALAADTIESCVEPGPAGSLAFMHRIARAGDGQELARARTVWSPAGP